MGHFSIATLDYQRASHVYNDYILPMAAGNLGHDVTSWQSQHRAGSSAVVTSKDEEQAHSKARALGWQLSRFDLVEIESTIWLYKISLNTLGRKHGLWMPLASPSQGIPNCFAFRARCSVPEERDRRAVRYQRLMDIYDRACAGHVFVEPALFPRMHWLMGGGVGEFLGDYMIT